MKGKTMSIDNRFSRKESFVVNVNGYYLMLPVSETTFDLVKKLSSATCYTSCYTGTSGEVFYSTGKPEIKLVDAIMFHDPNVKSQYEAIRRWDDACLAAKETGEDPEC
jgi:hypothetical protein